MTQKTGITAAGNWIVDRVKRVDCLPARGMLANIKDQTFSPGGAPANVLNDLARLQVSYRLAGLGVVGNDADGQYLRRVFSELGVDIAGLEVTDSAPTSFTDVMNDETTGDRVFFHNRGANALFSPPHVDIHHLDCRIFHLGYLLLLDAMDQTDPVYGTVAAGLLRQVQAAGILTSLDVVSEESDRFAQLVPPALKYVDYLILNEIETARAVGLKVRDEQRNLDGAALIEAVERLYEFGNMKLVAVHMPEGVYMRDQAGRRYSRGSLVLPEGYIAGAVGAGDAFCAGMLHGLHEDWDVLEIAGLASCCAAASLSRPGASEGVQPLEETLHLAKRFGERKPPVLI
ncbi:MAG: carbohydrate kinase family protein [bacterium]|jgi:sugar/nucleoside kinase (ribokinase family)